MSKYLTLRQLIRFGIELFNNLMGYLVYLIITFFGLDPKVAITLFYFIGTIIAYFTQLKYSCLYYSIADYI